MLLSVIWFVFLINMARSHNGPTVQTQQGMLQGVYQTSRYGRKFAAFQGIPYAQPPLRELRFKDPVPVEPWKGVWNASDPGNACIQIRRVPPPKYGLWERLTGDEDCLYLNIYTPKLPKDDSNPNLDVLFNIHSGAFMYGWGHEFGPEILMDRDVIWVTINYRLGPLGFLDTQDEVVPGNMGMKDQTVALRWIRDNIASFGGNPNSITLTGTSAGGGAVHLHYMSPWSRGLFKGGISQSGTATVPWVIMEEGRMKANQLGTLLGCPTENTRELVDCMRNRPAKQIIENVWHLQIWMYNPFSPFAPTVEVAGPNPFLTKHPIYHLLNGDVQDSPWICSVTTEDGLVPAGDWAGDDDSYIKELDRRFDELIVNILDFNFTLSNDKKQSVVKEIREHYFQNQPVSMKTFKQLVKLLTDRVYLLDGARAAKLQAAVKKSPVFFYLFGYRGKHSMTERLTGGNKDFGASHLDDTAYTIEYAFKTDETKEDREMSKILLDMWTSFAATGNPVPSGRKLKWIPTVPNSNDLTYLYIGGPDKLEMKQSSNLGDPKFWDSLPIQEKQLRVDTPIHTHGEF